MGFVSDPSQITWQVTPRTAEPEMLEVCKNFVGAGATASSTASFDVAGTLTSGASTTSNGSFSLANGECKEVFFSGLSETWSVNVGEGPSAQTTGTTMKITLYNGGATTSSTADATAASNLIIAPQHGALVEFTNTVQESSTGCTLTQGYWKTHPEKWTGAFTPTTNFYTSGKTYLQVLQTPANGDAYYILAYQFIAAQLNIAAGASSTAAVDAAIAGAKNYYTGTATSRTQLLAWAATLESYNSGLIGPGHCS
jgi:hypothetical protein